MSVIPMKLLTIAGPLEQFDPVAAACVLDREFHPENALALMERVSGLRPLSAADPYSAPLHRAEELLEAMDPVSYTHLCTSSSSSMALNFTT